MKKVVLLCLAFLGVQMQGAPAYSSPRQIAHWTFEESRDTAMDFSDNGHNGFFHEVTKVSSPWGKAVLFSGNQNSWVQINDHADFMQDSALSIEAFLTVTALPPEHGLIFFRGDNTYAADPYYLSVQPDKTILFHIETTGLAWDELETPIELNQPMHIVAAFSAAGQFMKIYINGALVASKTCGITPLRELPDPSNGGGVSIGNHTFPGQHYFPFTGTIDDLAFYNYPLGPDTVLTHYRAFRPVDTAQTMTSWTFDSVSGKTFYDVTGHGYDAVGTGDSFHIVPGGISGNALELRGVASDLNMMDIAVKNSVPAFNLQKFSIETWIYSYVNLYDPGSFYNQKSIFEFVSCGLEGSGVTGGYALAINDDGRPLFGWSSPTSGSWPYVIADSLLQPCRWYHIAATFDSVAARLYINGAMVAQMPSPQTYNPSAYAARIGCQFQVSDPPVGRTRNFFNGKIDEMKLYNYALDCKTLLQHYEALKAIAPLNIRPQSAKSAPPIPEIACQNGELQINVDPRQIARVRICTTDGRVLENRLFSQTNALPVRLSLAAYRKGAYVYQVTIGNETRTGRFIIGK